MRRHSTVVSYLALFVAVATGGAYAAERIGSGEIQPEAVKGRHIADGAVKDQDLAEGATDPGFLTARIIDVQPVGTQCGAVAGVSRADTSCTNNYLLSPPYPIEVTEMTVELDFDQAMDAPVGVILNTPGASSLSCGINIGERTCSSNDAATIAPNSPMQLEVLTSSSLSSLGGGLMTTLVVEPATSG